MRPSFRVRSTFRHVWLSCHISRSWSLFPRWDLSGITSLAPLQCLVITSASSHYKAHFLLSLGWGEARLSGGGLRVITDGKGVGL